MSLVISKIQPHHTNKLAYVYIRQSSPRQVRLNWGSTDIQRAMRDHAIALGFHPENIIIVDEDQAHSATTLKGRDGFKKMLLDIATGSVGAVFCSHSSRLFRSYSDSQQLLICCQITGTLIIEPDGVFDLQNDTDKIHWGFKNVMDEADSLRIRSMLMGGKLAKARKGRLRILLPTGFIWDGSGEESKIILEPDKQVQRAIYTAFNLLESCGSALSVVRHFNQKEMLFPSKILRGPRLGEYKWRPLTECRLMDLYHNPTYAGSYVYGRYSYQQKIHFEDRPVVKNVRMELDPHDWLVHIKEFHKGYISFEQYEANIQKLKDNQYNFGWGSKGAVRSGHALLQGLALCSKCKRRMQVKYQKGATCYYYTCCAEYSLLGLEKCQNVSGLCIDEVITRYIFQAFEPMHMEVSLEAIRQIEVAQHEVVRELERNLIRAQEAADYAEYRYLQVDRKNREVSDRLEEIFREKLIEVNRLKKIRTQMNGQTPQSPDPKELQAILALSKDFQAIWNSEKMTPKVRKQIIRAVIEKVDINREGRIAHLQIYWRTGVAINCHVKLKTGGDWQRTDSKIIDLIRELSVDHTDREIAQRLNELGLKSKRNFDFTYSIVQSLRDHHKIPTSFPESSKPSKYKPLNGQRSDGRYTTAEVARLLGVGQTTVSSWCQRGLLDGIRHTPKGSWWVRLTEKVIQTVKESGGLVPNKSHTGKIRAERLSTQRRSEISKKAAEARWSKRANLSIT